MSDLWAKHYKVPEMRDRLRKADEDIKRLEKSNGELVKRVEELESDNRMLNLKVLSG